MNLFYGILAGVVAQVITFYQLQGSAKWGWYDKYPILMLSLGVPISYFFIKSVHNIIEAYNGEIWPSRLLGFGIGIIVFYTMSYLLFKESVTLKTLVCLLLSCTIIFIQLYWK
jgi:multidrug transporter EmrE-like cation transporter